MEYRILEKKIILNHRFMQIEDVSLETDSFRGNKITFHRTALIRPQVVAVLLYHRQTDTFVTVRQFRYSAIKRETPWTVEIPAGVADDADESLQACAVRECMEETGYRVADPEYITMYMPSVGVSDQEVYMFYGEVEDSDRTASGGGLAHETEDIEVLHIPFSKMYQDYRDGKIYDAKTLLAFQWFLLHKRPQLHLQTNSDKSDPA